MYEIQSLIYVVIIHICLPAIPLRAVPFLFGLGYRVHPSWVNKNGTALLSQQAVLFEIKLLLLLLVLKLFDLKGKFFI